MIVSQINKNLVGNTWQTLFGKMFRTIFQRETTPQIMENSSLSYKVHVFSKNLLMLSGNAACSYSLINSKEIKKQMQNYHSECMTIGRSVP